MFSCSRSRLFSILFFFALFYLFVSFYSFIMKIKIALFFSIRSAIRNTRFESGRRASYITCIRCKSSLSYSRANQDGVLDVPILSHLSLYTSSFSLLSSPLPFYFVIPLSLFQRASSMRLTRWNFSTLFSRPCARISNSIVLAFAPALYFTCTLVPSRLSSNCPLSRIYTVYSDHSEWVIQSERKSCKLFLL